MMAAHAMMKLSVVSQINADVDSDSDTQETMDTEENLEARTKSASQDDDELNLLSDEEDKETGEKVNDSGLIKYRYGCTLSCRVKNST